MSDDKLEIEKLFNTKGIDDSIKGDWLHNTMDT